MVKHREDGLPAGIQSIFEVLSRMGTHGGSWLFILKLDNTNRKGRVLNKPDRMNDDTTSGCGEEDERKKAEKNLSCESSNLPWKIP